MGLASTGSRNSHAEPVPCWQGFNICLISRTASKLHAVEAEINAAFPNVLVKTAALDLAAANFEEVKSSVAETIKGLDVALLINNAGPVLWCSTVTAVDSVIECL